jgi:hypothetical protein
MMALMLELSAAASVRPDAAPHASPSARVDRLAQAIAAAVSAAARAPSGRAVRSDGWTPARVRLFLEALAARGWVCAAARAAGMNPRSAYIRRRREAG